MGDERFISGETALVLGIAPHGDLVFARSTPGISASQAAAWLRAIADRWDVPAADTDTEDPADLCRTCLHTRVRHKIGRCSMCSKSCPEFAPMTPPVPAADTATEDQP